MILWCFDEKEKEREREREREGGRDREERGRIDRCPADLPIVGFPFIIGDEGEGREGPDRPSMATTPFSLHKTELSILVRPRGRVSFFQR